MKKRFERSKKMKKWKTVKKITVVVLILFIIRLIIDAILCMNMTYPHPMLGIDANKWTDQFGVDLAFILVIWGIPLIIDIIFLVISCVKTKEK